MNFSTEDILRALREGATDADLATSFASALNEATKLHEEENARAKAAEAKEVLYEDCATAFTDVLAAEGIDEPVTAKDIHDIVDSIKNAGTLLEKLVGGLGDIFSTLDKEVPKTKSRKHISSDDDIIRSFLASL